MCPACIATMTLFVASSASTGGLTALVAKRFRPKSGGRLPQANQSKNCYAERVVDQSANKYERKTRI